MKKLLTIIFTIALLTFTSSVNAEKRYTANDGLDETGCGAKSNPCRSISFTISQASPNDSIIVGPGIYGDINKDGDTDDDGEETALANSEAMIVVPSAIKIFSRDGARATFIHEPGDKEYSVYLKSSNVTLGRKNRGFSVDGGKKAALFVEGSNSRILSSRISSSAGHGILAGCIPALTDQSDPEYRGFSSGGRIQDCTISHNSGSGAYICDNTANWRLQTSDLTSNTKYGLYLGGSNHALNQVTITNNNSTGLYVLSASNTSITKSLIIGNLGSGVSLGDASGFSFKNTSLIGNYGSGLFYSQSDLSTSNCNVYGNFATNNAGGLYINCGIFDNTSNNPSPDDNYWGSMAGPSSTEPADEYCSQVKSTSVNKFLTKEKVVRTAQPKQ